MQELEHKLASVAQVEISLELITIMYTADIVTEQGDAGEDSLQHPRRGELQVTCHPSLASVAGEGAGRQDGEPRHGGEGLRGRGEAAGRHGGEDLCQPRQGPGGQGQGEEDDGDPARHARGQDHAGATRSYSLYTRADVT